MSQRHRDQPLRGDAVRGYIENLLPDSKDVRERMTRRLGVSAGNAYDLLAEVGRDCVGALEILPEGAVPIVTGPLKARPLDEAEMAQGNTPTTHILAMAVRSKNPHWEMRSILRRHWLALGALYGITTEDRRPAAELIDEILEAVPRVVAAVEAELPPGFPDEVASRILKGLLDAAGRLKFSDPSTPGGPG